MEKVQWNSINQKQNGLKQSKNKKSYTLPWMPFWNEGLNHHNNLALRSVQYANWKYRSKHEINKSSMPK